MNQYFSKTTKEVIAHSKDIAVHLGSEFSNSFHFFVSDCDINQDKSIKNFIFKDDIEYKQFCKRYIVSEPSIFLNKDNSLTKEAEKTIRLSLIEKREYFKENKVEPYHLFLAASKNKESVFFQMLTPKEGLYERLIEYYVEKNIISFGNTENNPLFKLFGYFKQNKQVIEKQKSNTIISAVTSIEKEYLAKNTKSFKA